MAKAFIKHNFSAVAQDVICVWYENGAPLAEVGREVIEAPHTEGSLTVTDLNPVMHSFKFYQSSNGTTLETLLVSLDIDAAISNEAFVELYEFEVGDGQEVGDGNPAHLSPVQGDTEYLNDNLADGDITRYEVVQRGYGPLSWRNEIEEIETGGFRFTNDFIFNENDRYFITVYKLVTSSAGNTVTTQAQFTDVAVLSENIEFGSALYNKLLIADWAGRVGVIDIPDLSSIPNNTALHLNAHQGAQWYVTLHMVESGDTIFFNGVEVDEIHLGRGEEIRIVFKNGAAYVVSYSGDAKRRGEVIMSDKVLLNSFLANGTEYNTGDLPGLMEALSTEQIVTYAAWDAFQDVVIGEITKRYYLNRGKFAVDNVAGKVKLPDYRGQSFRILKSFDGTTDATRLSQGSGSLQAQEIISHKHGEVPKKRNDVDRGNGSSLFSTDENGSTAATGGTEQRVDNVGKYAIVLI
ncbi:MAG: hypothetical protein V4615_04885 [Bacteroidota bacterium]